MSIMKFDGRNFTLNFLLLACIVTLQIIPVISSDEVIVDKSYGERIKDSFLGFIIGIFLVIFSVPVIWIVEQDAVEYFLILSRCRKGTRKITDSSMVTYQYDQRPIYLHGLLNIPYEDVAQAHIDLETGFELPQPVIRMKRTVEVYQWVESSRKEEKRTVYNYDLKWSEADIDSNKFKESYGHYNPPRRPNIHSKTTDCSCPHVGAFQLSTEQVFKLERFINCPITEFNSLIKLHKVERGPKYDSSTDYITCNGSLSAPTPGTMRISYEAIMTGSPVSLVAVQQGKTFRAFTKQDAHQAAPSFLNCFSNPSSVVVTKNKNAIDGDFEGNEPSCCFFVGMIKKLIDDVIGDRVLLVEEDEVSPEVMFNHEKSKLMTRIYLMRLLGCLMLSIGLYLIFNPIAVILSFIPYLSGMISNFFFIVAMILGFSLGILLISTAWVLYHPEYMAVFLLCSGVFLIWSGSIFSGEICCFISLFPIVIWGFHKIEDMRYDSLVNNLDQCSSESAPLLAKSV